MRDTEYLRISQYYAKKVSYILNTLFWILIYSKIWNILQHKFNVKKKKDTAIKHATGNIEDNILCTNIDYCNMMSNA